MVKMTHSSTTFFTKIVLFLILVVFFTLSPVADARPATFLQDFRITWSDSHIKQLDGGKAIQLVLDQNSGKYTYTYIYSVCLVFRKPLIRALFFDIGCGFASKSQYLFGRVSMKIKLIPGDSAGTVTAFYVRLF